MQTKLDVLGATSANPVQQKSYYEQFAEEVFQQILAASESQPESLGQFLQLLKSRQ